MSELQGTCLLVLGVFGLAFLYDVRRDLSVIRKTLERLAQNNRPPDRF